MYTKYPTVVKLAVCFHHITEYECEQRIDNFLFKRLKNVPHSRIYRIIRKGEVRVNKKRVKAKQKLITGDIIRIPPIKIIKNKTINKAPKTLLHKISQRILYEDENFIIINKPSGLAVHGGSNIYSGLIETFRQLRPNLPFVELIHRLDKETSGVVMLAKNRKVLIEMHNLLRTRKIAKHYQTLVLGQWQGKKRIITSTLVRNKKGQKQNKIQIIKTKNNKKGKLAKTIIIPAKHFQHETLLNVQILTGRMHQIRVQLADLKHPIIADTRYGNFSANRKYKSLGIERLFLHAKKIHFCLPSSGKRYTLIAPLPPNLQQIIQNLSKI